MKHSQLSIFPWIDLRRCCVFQVHESRTHSAIHSRRTADNGLAIQRCAPLSSSSCFSAMMVRTDYGSLIMWEKQVRNAGVCEDLVSCRISSLSLILVIFCHLVSKIKSLLMEHATEFHSGLACAEQERLRAARHHVSVARVAPRSLQHGPHVWPAQPQRPVTIIMVA